MQSARGSTEPQDAWDDESFALTPLSIEEEEDKFVAPKHQLTGDDAVEYAYADEDRPPALLVDLTALAAEQQQTDVATLREQVMATLHANWNTKSGELMAAGVCWHVPERETEERRLAHEASQPGAVLTVIHYPSQVDGVRTGDLVRSVMRPTPWEVADAIKTHVAQSRRPLKWQADLCVEVEELAEQEASWGEQRAERRDALANLLAERQRTHDMLHAAKDPATDSAATMLGRLFELDAEIAAAKRAEEEAAEEEGAEGGGGTAPSPMVSARC